MNYHVLQVFSHFFFSYSVKYNVNKTFSVESHTHHLHVECVCGQGLLTPENCPKGKDNDDVVVETYFVFAAIW